jgi:hypothetical protein
MNVAMNTLANAAGEHGKLPSLTPTSSNAGHPVHQLSDEDTLPKLETQLSRLHQYADELLVLSMQESHHLLQREIHMLEERIKQIKRERSEKILHELENEFPALAGVRDGIRREGRRLGYF